MPGLCSVGLSHTHSSLPHSLLTPTITPPGIAQAHASEAMEKEREFAEKEMALQSRITSLEAQVKGLRQDKTKQEALLEAERAKLAALEEGSQKLVCVSNRQPWFTQSRSWSGLLSLVVVSLHRASLVCVQGCAEVGVCKGSTHGCIGPTSQGEGEVFAAHHNLLLHMNSIAPCVQYVWI